MCFTFGARGRGDAVPGRTLRSEITDSEGVPDVPRRDGYPRLTGLVTEGYPLVESQEGGCPPHRDKIWCEQRPDCVQVRGLAIGKTMAQKNGGECKRLKS